MNASKLLVAYDQKQVLMKLQILNIFLLTLVSQLMAFYGNMRR